MSIFTIITTVKIKITVNESTENQKYYNIYRAPQKKNIIMSLVV